MSTTVTIGLKPFYNLLAYRNVTLPNRHNKIETVQRNAIHILDYCS